MQNLSALIVSSLTALLLGGSTAAASAWQDGSLIVLQNSNKPVQTYTGSEITHVALLRMHGPSPWVYEATPAKVRRVPLAAYMSEIAQLNDLRRAPIRMWVIAPKQPYSKPQLAAMHGYLDTQLGRRYSIKGYLRGQAGDGLHCAEYAAVALSCTGRHRFDDFQKLSPSAMVKTVSGSHQAPRRLNLGKSTADPSWCLRTWERWTSLQLWCSWACYEIWMFWR